MNLAEALTREINRNQELLHKYKEIGSAGAFITMSVSQEIETAIKAKSSGDITEMLISYGILKDNE